MWRDYKRIEFCLSLFHKKYSDKNTTDIYLLSAYFTLQNFLLRNYWQLFSEYYTFYDSYFLSITTH
jgi:hypothetical protein